MDFDSDSTPSQSSQNLARDSFPSSPTSVSNFTTTTLNTPEFTNDLDVDFLDFSDEDDDDDVYGTYAGHSNLSLNLDEDDKMTMPALTRKSSAELSPSLLPPSIYSSSISSSETPSLEQASTDRSRSSSETGSESEGELLDASSNLDYFSFPSFSHAAPDTLSDSGSGSPPSPNVGYTPHASMYSNYSESNTDSNEPEVVFEPGTSAGTIRASLHMWAASRRKSTQSPDNINKEVVDGSGWGGERYQGSGSGRAPERNGGEGNGNGRGGGDDYGRFSRNDRQGGGSGSGGKGDDGRDGKDGKDGRQPISQFSSSSSSDESSSDEEEENSTDDYGDALQHTAEPSPAASSDDDVPLAQRIPTALKAQRTIRKQVKDERDERRKERALKKQQLNDSRSRQTTLRPIGAGGSQTPQAAMTSSQEAAMHASQFTKRARTQTLPSSTAPFPIEDLTRKLLNVQDANLVQPQRVSRGHQSRAPSKDPSEKNRMRKETSPKPQPAQAPVQAPERGLRPMRSFHRLEGRHVDDHRAVPMPSDAKQMLGRSATSAKARLPSEAQNHSSQRSFSEEAHTRPLERTKTHRSSEERSRMTRDTTESPSSRPSTELGSRSPPRPSMPRPPLPPLPHEVLANIGHSSKAQVTQQRIFVGDVQRFNMVEVGPSTNAGNVLDMVEAQGTLKGWVGSGGWMLWEVAQDFGMG